MRERLMRRCRFLRRAGGDSGDVGFTDHLVMVVRRRNEIGCGSRWARGRRIFWHGAAGDPDAADDGVGRCVLRFGRERGRAMLFG